MKKFFEWLKSLFSSAPTPEAPTQPAPSQPSSKPYASWPHQEWAKEVERQVIAYGLDKLKPDDAKDFFPNGLSVRNWVHLLGAMAKHESGFSATKEYRENFKNGAGETTISTGIFQLSYHTQRSVYGFQDATTTKLKEPFYNIHCAVHILHRWVKSDGVIARPAKDATGKFIGWRGGSRYWAVLRTPKVDTQVKKTLKAWAE